MPLSQLDQQIGNRIRDRRIAMGLSQANLANLLGITFQQVQKYEKGTSSLNTWRIKSLSDVMNVPISYFFEDIGNHIRGEMNGNASERECLEVIKAFKTIYNPITRKRLYELIRVMAD